MRTPTFSTPKGPSRQVVYPSREKATTWTVDMGDFIGLGGKLYKRSTLGRKCSSAHRRVMVSTRDCRAAECWNKTSSACTCSLTHGPTFS